MSLVTINAGVAACAAADFLSPNVAAFRCVDGASKPAYETINGVKSGR